MEHDDRPGMTLAEIRRASGRTQAQVAEHMEVSRSTVSRLERAGDMTVSRLQRFMRACGARAVFEIVHPDGHKQLHHPQEG